MINRRLLLASALGAAAWGASRTSALGHHGEAVASELTFTGPLGDIALGPAEAPVTIIEYASMTCSHCARFHVETWPALKDRYVTPGRVRFIFREFPLDMVAFGVSILMRAAPVEQFFPLAETLFRRKEEWAHSPDPVPLLRTIFAAAGLSQEGFDAALNDRRLVDGVNAVRQHAGSRLGVNSTPTFFVNGHIERGFHTPAQMDSIIEPLLAGR